MTPNNPAPSSGSTRRQFLKTTSAVALTTAVTPLAAARGVRRRNDVLRVGLVGCGGRGTGAAAQALTADPDTRLVALADTFGDQLDKCLTTLRGSQGIADRIDVADDMKFVGFDAYKGVVDNCDVVLLATSPYFRPMHVAYAVEAGKHLFVEKPIATDAPGVRSMLASVELARQKGLSLVSGLCYRYSFAKQATVERIHDGAIGDITSLQTTYNTTGLWHRGRKEDWSDMEWQIRNWLYFTWLSGDHITEQHIHSLDKIAWTMGSYPVKVTASGGRAVRTDPKYGNIYDHFNSVFEFENDVKCFSSCRQWNGASSDVSDHVFGTKGVAHLQSHKIDGEHRWRWRSDEPDDMYQNEHDVLFAAIRAGEPVNNGEYMCHSTLMAIMARMSAYTGQTVTWEEALASQEDLSPTAFEWSALEVRPVARPGVTKFS